ncbi:BCCT family transporter [Halobacterium yunchengense]|uniref:BCCT family transporter n=1 Tax=Halobacterium yunchengense TaxID=3108497 RepID=UPI003008D99A
MTTRSDGLLERRLRQLLLPVAVLSGGLVVTGFFFPGFVGSTVSGRGWLVVSLLFFSAGLSYLAVLPSATDQPADGDGRSARYLLRIRHGHLRPLVAPFVARQDPVTFGVPVAVLTAFFAVRLLAPDATTAAIGAAKALAFGDLGWVFLAAMVVAVAYAAFLVVGPWGDVRLGGPDAEPTYTYPTYFALFFTAGIAAGIVFWGPAEALFHYRSPPPYFGAAPQSEVAAVDALAYTLFHWGASAWSAYLVVGVPIAYFVHNRGAPLRVSTLLAPLLGVDRLDGRAGKTVDVLAVFATIGGVGTSIAFVSRQFLTGIDYQWSVSYGLFGPVALVAGLTVIYLIPAQTGVHRGVRRVAGVTVALFGLFVALLLALGPRGFVLDSGVAALGRYAVHFAGMSAHAGGQWVADWTVWNWSWWFSWAPFAGLFLAALSTGRTVRTVVLTAVGATSLATVLWFLVMGGTTLAVQHTGRADVLAAVDAYGGSEAVAGFPVLAALPMSRLLMFLFLALIVVFITTSAAVSTLVVAILGTERGSVPTTGSIAFWGAVQGVVATAVLLVGGGQSLQDLAVLTGGPFAVLSVVALGGLTWTFRRDERGHRSLPGKVRAYLDDRDVTLVPERPDLRDDETD